MKHAMFSGFALCLTTLLLSACVGTPTITDKPGKDEYSSFLQVKSTQLDDFYLASASALQGYNALYFEPLELSNMELDLGRLDFQQRDWYLTDKEQQDMVRYFAEEVSDEFGSGEGMALAQSKGPGVIVAQTELVKFYPSATRYDSAYRGARDEIFTRSVGLLKMKTTFTDAATGKVLAVILDNDEVGENSLNKSNDRVNNTRRIKQTFAKWVKYMRDATTELVK